MLMPCDFDQSTVPDEGLGHIYLLSWQILAVLLIVFPDVDHHLPLELRDGHSPHLGDFPILIPLCIELWLPGRGEV
jgi:hypothetical protein